MKKKRKILLAVLLLVFIFVVAYTLHWYYIGRWMEVGSRRTIDDVIHVERGRINQDDVLFIVEDTIFITREHFLAPQYLVLRSSKGIRLRNLSDAPDWEIVEVNIYDMFSREVINTINVLELQEEYASAYRFNGDSSAINMRITMGGEKLSWQLRSLIDPDGPRRFANLDLNLETNEVTVLTRDLNLIEERPYPPERRDEFEREMSIFSAWPFTDAANWPDTPEKCFLTLNGLSETGERDEFHLQHLVFPGVVGIRISATNLPVNSQELYERFPGLKAFQGEEGLMVNIILTGFPSAEEIATMFMEDGQEISFDGLIIRDRSSIDGEAREIHSFEDFVKWVN